MKSVMGDERLGASYANSDHWAGMLLSVIVIFTTETVTLVIPSVRTIASLPYACGAIVERFSFFARYTKNGKLSLIHI
eukprot:578068-Lingulodinium_polyedra.AAC.1